MKRRLLNLLDGAFAGALHWSSAQERAPGAAGTIAAVGDRVDWSREFRGTHISREKAMRLVLGTVGFLFVGSMTVGAGEVSPKVAAHPPRAAADTRPPEPPAPPLGVAAADETDAERQWLDRVRRLPEIWPGGTDVMTDRRARGARRGGGAAV